MYPLYALPLILGISLVSVLIVLIINKRTADGPKQTSRLFVLLVVLLMKSYCKPTGGGGRVSLVGSRLSVLVINLEVLPCLSLYSFK